MPELKDLIASIKDYMGDDEDKKTEVADALHAGTPALAQVFIDKGAGLGKDALKKQLKELKSELASTKEKLETAETELEQSQGKAPEEIQRLTAKITKLEGQLETANTKLTEEQSGRKGDKRETAIERLITKLEPGHKVIPESIAAIKAQYGDRIRISEDGTLEVLQLDSEAVYAPAKGQDAIELLAADVIKKLPAPWRLTGVESGGGQGGGGGSGGGGGKGEKDPLTQFQKQRDQVPNPLLPQKQTTQQGSTAA